MNRIKKEKPLVTLIVPVYNGERYLAECIESILNQDYKKVELILVNDGSTDHSAEILEKYSSRDDRVFVLQQKNSGVSTARNLALHHSHGEYICFVDQDDYIASDYVSYFYKLIIETGAEIALTPHAKRFTSSKYERTKSSYKDSSIDVWTGEKAAQEMLYYNLVIAPWNKMISCNLIVRNKISFNPRCFGGEGFNFSMDCFQRTKKVAVGHRRIYYYRVDNPDSGMTTFSLQMVNRGIEAVELIEANLVNKTPELLRACKYAYWHTNCDFYNTMIGCGVTKQFPDVYHKLKYVCQSKALCAIKAPVSIKEKMKGVAYYISPYLAANIINCLRIRKFTKSS